MPEREDAFIVVGILLMITTSGYFFYGTALDSGPSVAEYERQKTATCDRLSENIGATYTTTEYPDRNITWEFDLEFDLDFEPNLRDDDRPLAGGGGFRDQGEVVEHTITREDVEECRNQTYEEWVEGVSSTVLTGPPFPIVEGSMLTLGSMSLVVVFAAELTGWRR